jgi:hypothetical protein
MADSTTLTESGEVHTMPGAPIEGKGWLPPEIGHRRISAKKGGTAASAWFRGWMVGRDERGSILALEGAGQAGGKARLIATR